MTIEVDKTEARIGDKIKVTATLKNLSGKAIRIKMSHTRYKKPEDMIMIELFNENDSHSFVVTRESGPLSKMTIPKDAVVTRTREFTIEKYIDYGAGGVETSVNYDAASGVVFYTGMFYKQIVGIYSDQIKIIVEE